MNLAELSGSLGEALLWLERSPAGEAVRSTPYLYPLLMSAHVLGIALLVGPAVAVDLRLLGLARRAVPVSVAAKHLLPISHVGFAIAAATGVAMLLGIGGTIATSAASPWKSGLIALAGVNILLFHRGVYRSVSRWNSNALPPARARAAAVISALAWSGVIVAGRFLSY